MTPTVITATCPAITHPTKLQSGFGCAKTQVGKKRNAVAAATRKPSRVDALGGGRVLSSYLGVEPAQVERWLAGLDPVPLPAFMGALDVIADGPYVGQRPIRVAAIKT